MLSIRTLVPDLFRRFGYELRRSERMKQLEVQSDFGSRLLLLNSADALKGCSIQEASRIIGQSKSQLGQDMFALALKGVNDPGFFVEFGASDGLTLSNSYILEKEFGWDGILCEPGVVWHEDLEANREVAIDKRCVLSESGKTVIFSETSMGELSTIQDFLKVDGHRRIRKVSNTYSVSTVSLFDLLQEHRAPKYIDFLSVDTEGSEYAILENFDFEIYEFGLICVEHNYTKSRAKLKNLLESKGYMNVHKEQSQFDDWYVSHKNFVQINH